MNISEQVIKEAGAQQAMTLALQSREDHLLLKDGMLDGKAGEPDQQTRDMFHDIQCKLAELSTIEKFQREITDVKNSQLRVNENLNLAQ